MEMYEVERCAASGDDWSCSRTSKEFKMVSSVELCEPHYRQSSRNEPLKPLRIKLYPGAACVASGDGWKCEKPRRFGEMCSGHTEQRRRGKELRPLKGRYVSPHGKCEFDDCEEPHDSKGLCKAHMLQLRRGKKLTPIGICKIDGCSAPYRARGMCGEHYEQLSSSMKKECSFEECGNVSKVRGLCAAHYQQWRTRGELAPVRQLLFRGHIGCSVPECGRPHKSRGFCEKHALQKYRQERRERAPRCNFGDCDKPATGRGLCTGHYQQWKRREELRPLRPRRGTNVYKEMVARGVLVCVACGNEHPLEEFSPAGKGTRRAYCKPCNARIVRLRKYGITFDQLKELEEFQGYACAICGSRQATSGSRGPAAWHIDHDHNCCGTYERACGECVRGLLCESCNTRGLAWYEGLPAGSLISVPELDDYISNPPMKRLRAARYSVIDYERRDNPS
jgi:hypothetical protein